MDFSGTPEWLLKGKILCAHWVVLEIFFVIIYFKICYRYGFITFENQEDADRIIKKEVCLTLGNINVYKAFI